MKRSLLIILAAVVFSAGNVFGETYYVLSGDKIQPAVDKAKTGDTVVIFGGQYPYDVIIDNKNIKLKKPLGEEVTINGDVYLKNIKGHFELTGFTVNGDGEGNETIDVINCNNIKFSGIKTRRMDVHDSNAIIHNCSIVNLQLIGSKCSTVVTKSNITDWLDLYGSSQKGHVFFQNTILHARSHGAKQNLIFGYNKMRALKAYHIGELTLVGNVFDGAYNGPGNPTHPDGYFIYQDSQGHDLYNEYPSLVFWNMYNKKDCKLNVYNNVFRNANEGDIGYGFNGINLVRSAGTHVRIYNNLFYKIHSLGGGSGKGNRGNGITSWESPALMEIKGNVFYKIKSFGSKPIWAPFDNVKVHNNFAAECEGWNKGGYRGEGNISGSIDEHFVGFNGGDYRLVVGSKLINGGPEEPWHTDRDGTRNDIGLYGGSFFDPNGFTTKNPVILFSNHEPLQLIKGKDKTIKISAGGIVVP